MQTNIKTMINSLEGINTIIKERDDDFDAEDVIETYNRSHEILENISDDLKKSAIEDKQRIEAALVKMNTEVLNLIWCFDELREFAIRTLRKIN